QEAMRQGVRAVGTGIAAGKQKLQDLVAKYSGTYPALKDLGQILDGAIDETKDVFVTKAEPCPDKLTDNIKGTIGFVLTCFKNAAKDAFKGGLLGGAKELMRIAIVKFGDGIEAGKAKITEFMEKFKNDVPEVSGLSEVLSAATEAGKDVF